MRRIGLGGALVAVFALLLLGACALGTKDKLIAAASQKSPAVVVHLNPEIPSHLLATADKNKVVCMRTDSRFIVKPTVLRYVQEVLATSLQKDGYRAEFDCPSPVLKLFLQDAGIASVSDVQRFLASGYGTSVSLGAIAEDLSIHAGPSSFDLGTVSGYMLKQPVSLAAVPELPIYVAILDVSVYKRKELHSRMVVQVPYGHPDWRTELWGGGVVRALLDFFS